MPSRNKKNKNRTQTQPTTSGTSAAKNGTTPVKINEDAGPSNEPESEPKSDLKSTISVAREKLDQLQQTVNSIKASISQANAAKSDEKPSDAATEESVEQPFETQTMKKKRNRNRNRNRNKNSQSNLTDESGMSSTSGTNENSTHENSPTAAALTTIILPTSDVITSEIIEEPAQNDTNEAKEEVERTEITENVVNATEPETITEASPKIEEIESKADKNETKIEETSTKIVKSSTEENEKVAPTETPTPVEIKESEAASKELEKTDEKIEQLVEESDKRPKENEKQKKNRQAKNANKNQKEKPNADVEPPKQNGNKIDSNANLDKTVDTIETKADLPDVKKLDAEPKNKNNKTAKENKKSPKMNKKNQPSESGPIETEEKTSVELSDITSDNGKSNDGNENAVSQKDEEPKETIIESEKPSANEESIQAEQQPSPIEQIPLPEPIQSENSSSESKLESENIAKPDLENQPTPLPEHKKEKVAKDKAETKQQPSETKPTQSTTVSSKESKKSKGKKSPPQPKVQNGQKESKGKENSSDEKIEPVLVKKEEIQSDKSTSKESNVVEPLKEGDVEETRKELPTQSETTEVQSVKIEETTEEKVVEVVEESVEAAKVETPNPSSTIEAVKEESVSKGETASISKAQPTNEVEAKKLASAPATSNDETINTPNTTPILTTPAPGTSKKAVQNEDETSKIWKILEEASKSLEPVEIEMEDPTISSLDPPPAAPIACSSKDEQQAKEGTEELVTILETKEPVKTKQGAQPKASKTKENNQAPKQSSPTKTNESPPKQSSPTKMIDSPPKKAVDPKKKESKPAQKNSKPTKAAQSQTTSSSEKALEKTPEKTVKIAETPPVEIIDEAVALATEEIPLDVSIMPNEIEVAELNADSKNVQGSGSVPFVEQSTAAAESLVLENDDTTEAVQSIQARDSKSKSKSPAKEKMQESTQTKVPSQPSENVKEIKESDTKANDEKIENIAKPTPTQSNKSQSKSPQSKSPSKSVSVSPEKSKQSLQNSKQKEVNTKNAQGKVAQNNKKANGKPAVPPKPDHLVSSQAKKTQVPTGKSESAVKSKTEKILVLTGNIEDDDSEDDYIEYKFMPRQVFISTICQACKKPTTLSERVLCQHCQMVSYCCADHGKTDEPNHKDLCAALQEIAKKRGGHIYNNARILNNNDYRSLRVHTLNLCENFLKRPLQTFEREILLFPRLCSTPTCREWRQNLLSDCPGCGQVFFCTSQPEHLVETHQRWCKSVALYQKLVVTQSVSGRIEPSLPSRIQTKPYTLPNNIGDVFKDLYKNYSAIKDDCIFATLTQLATAPLTAYFATQKAGQQIGEKFTIHLIGAELQFEADVLDIWETFFLHLAHNLMELTIVFCGPELNAENIPLDIISRIRMCRTCRQNCRIVKFDFQCAKFYHDYAKSSAYSKPDLICFFNPGFHHINSLNGMDTWSETIKIASSSGCPVVVTSYTEFESPRDLDRFQNESSNGGKQMTVIHGPEFNAYSSQRPERNFISDEMVPLIFKNYYCFIMK